MKQRIDTYHKAKDRILGVVYPDKNDQSQWHHYLLSDNVNIAILWGNWHSTHSNQICKLKYIRSCGDYIWRSSKKPNRLSQEFHEILILVKCNIIRHLMLSIIPYLYKKKIHIPANLYRLVYIIVLMGIPCTYISKSFEYVYVYYVWKKLTSQRKDCPKNVKLCKIAPPFPIFHFCKAVDWEWFKRIKVITNVLCCFCWITGISLAKLLTGRWQDKGDHKIGHCYVSGGKTSWWLASKK